MSEPKNINVNIANVISWFEESEQCMLHNHAELIPTTKSVMLDLITKIKHASMTNSDYDAIVLKESIEELRKVVQTSYDKTLSNSFDKVQHWKKIADDWRMAAIALATDAGDPHMALDCYEDIREDLSDKFRERMYITPSTAKRVFDGIHDYAILLSTKAGEAQELRVAAEDASDAENTYYWDGYEAALDFAIDSLPNYNN